MDITTSMKESSSAISITGEFNKERDEECEDVMHIDEISGIKLFGLADGQTGKKHCRIQISDEKHLEHYHRLYRRSAVIQTVIRPAHIVNEREIDVLVYLPQEMIGRHEILYVH